ncbi:MAG: hypothetical protein KDA41_22310, partial [Planctomycetales bacterium]|nr:hypothetical protein [Planctomycetales bacterium]
MTATISEDAPAAETARGAARRELTLRMQSGDGPQRVLRLPHDKFSIGADASCAVRLDSSAFHPVHCFILRGKAGVVVRRWAPDTRLNGRVFQDALLAQGDRLSVGPVDFDVLDIAEATPETDPSHALGEMAGEVRRLSDALAQKQSEFDAAHAAWDEQRCDLADELARLADENSAAQQRLADALSELERRDAEWESQARQYEQARADLETQASSLSQEQQADEQARARLEEALDRRDQEFAERHKQHAREIEFAQSQLRDSAVALAAAEAKAQSEAARWESLLAERDAELASLAQQLDDAQTQIEEQSARLERARHELHAVRDGQTEELQQSFSTLHDRTADVQRREAELAERDETLAAQRAELDELRESLRTQQAELEEQNGRLERDREELAAAQRQLDET